jgi:hypothetical protein
MYRRAVKPDAITTNNIEATWRGRATDLRKLGQDSRGDSNNSFMIPKCRARLPVLQRRSASV